ELGLLTVRDVHRSRGKGTSAADVRGALALLEEHGFVRLERQPTAKQGGRPSERVHVHPSLAEVPDRPDKTDKTLAGGGPVGFVRSVSGSSEVAETAHPDPDCQAPGRWLARDGAWRCLACNPPGFPSEIVEQEP